MENKNIKVLTERENNAVSIALSEFKQYKREVFQAILNNGGDLQLAEWGFVLYSIGVGLCGEKIFNVHSLFFYKNYRELRYINDGINYIEYLSDINKVDYIKFGSDNYKLIDLLKRKGYYRDNSVIKQRMLKV